MREELEELKKNLLADLDTTQDILDDELYDRITRLVMNAAFARGFSVKERIRITEEIFHSIRGLDILQEILNDPTVTEIMVNSPDTIFVEKEGRLFRYPGQFSSPEKLRDVIQLIAAGANKRVNESTPIVDTRLPDGSRVNIVMCPISLRNPVLTIRKFPKEGMTMKRLVKLGSITEEAAGFLETLVKYGYNIFISGGTGSGKTTFLNALSGYIPSDERIITIEDSAELQISGIENLVSLECRQANVEGENEVTIRDLIRTSLRMRPNRIIVGEVRGGEALDMLQAMNTGHDGSLSTGHANSPADMLTRLETMVLMGTNMPLSAIKSQIASALDILVHLGRLPDGSRAVMEIAEVLDFDGTTIPLNTLFTFQRNRTGGVGRIGHLVASGNPLRNRTKGGMHEPI